MAREDEAPCELHVCIVNWRTAGMTVDCLRSIAQERANARLRVFVVDNASGDGSFEQIGAAIHENGWGAWAQVIAAERNGGFAYGNNMAIRALRKVDASVPFVLLLNPDTVVRPGAFRTLLDFMAAHPEVGLAGGLSEDPDGTPQHCSFRFLTPVGEFLGYARLGVLHRILGRWSVNLGIPANARQVDWVSGAVLMIRREVFEQIGLLDETYFLYFEETDFILRARRAGWTCWHVPESRVIHLVGQSSGVTKRDAAPKRIPAYWFESRRRYFALNHGRMVSVLADIAAATGCAIAWIKHAISRRPAVNPPHFVADLLRHGTFARSDAALAPRKTNL
jgi:N-acetylglucosaminyl-diphospho-decaprenol L-rhamnosyltransferase